MFNTKSKKEEPVIISPSFQLPIILIVLSFMLLFLNIGSLPTIVFASFSFFLLLQSFTLRIKITNDNFKLITPGIRLKIENKDDQNRIMTPHEAIDNGASKLVIGRSISKAIDPNKALIEIFKSIDSD